MACRRRFRTTDFVESTAREIATSLCNLFRPGEANLVTDCFTYGPLEAYDLAKSQSKVIGVLRFPHSRPPRRCDRASTRPVS
jgi:hypothetical protein